MKRFLPIWLCAASCLWAGFAAWPAAGQESTIFLGADSPNPSQRADSWTPATGRWTASRRNAPVQPAGLNAAGPSPTFPQIKNPLDMPQLGDAGAEPQPADDSILPAANTCPDCGAPLNAAQPGFCERCLCSTGKLFHLLSPKRWFQDESALRPQREPWRFRPFSIGLFMGPIIGSPLISDSIQQGTGFMAGGRFGYDFDEDWGIEMRIASANFPVMGGYPVDGTQHSSDHFLMDIDFLYYPWEDAAIRPYILMGVGTARIKFADQLGNEYSRIMAGMPIGIGLKFKMSDWFVFRVECLDNVAFATGGNFGTQHNLSLTGGLEIRFGRPHVQYWPWNPGMKQ